jgi:hypothetical protein
MAPDHGVGTHHAPVPNRRAGQHRHPEADPYIGSDIDGPAVHSLFAYPSGIGRHAVVSIANRGILAHLRVVSDAHRVDGRDKNILGQRDSTSDLQARAGVDIKATTLPDKYVVA